MSNITFELVEVNMVRACRDKEHAKFRILEDGKQVDCRWLDNEDIALSIKDHPTQKDTLKKGLI